MEKEAIKIEAGDNTCVYNPPTRKERVELLKQTHNDLDNIEEMLENYIKVSRKALKECGKEFKEEIRNHFGFYNDLRKAWEDMARRRYPYIVTLPDQGVIYLLLDESPSSADSTIVKMGSGLGDYFYVDDGRDIILVRDIPSAVEAMKLFDKTYKQKIRSQYSSATPKLPCWHKEEEDDECY